MNNPKLTGLILLCSLSAPFATHAEQKTSPDTIPGSTKVSAEAIYGLVESIPDLVIIDARIRGDRKIGFIEGSTSLPDVETNCQSLKKVIKTRKSPSLFYCNGPKCGRSAKSVQKALDCGYTNIYWFRGGFEEWKAKGFPIVKR